MIDEFLRKFNNDVISQNAQVTKRNNRSAKYALATVQSIQTGTITVQFLRDASGTVEVSGVILPPSISVIVGDTVKIVNANNSLQSSAWEVTNKI